MITIPHWIDAPRGEQLPDEQRAERRLRYVMYAILQITHCAPTVRQLCIEIGREPSGIATAMSRGHFSREMAKEIETFVGADVISAHHLVYPLEIPSA